MKGPKEMLAELLTEALADFFVIDPATVETNLISNAGITLKDVQLKEMKIPINDNAGAIINGGVNHVNFSWSWGGDGKGSDWIKDTRLSIVGVTFFVLLSGEKLESTVKTNTNEEKRQDDENAATKNGLATYIE